MWWTKTLGVGSLTSMPVMAYLASRNPDFSQAQAALAAVNFGVVGLWLFLTGAKVGSFFKKIEHIVLIAVVLVVGVNVFLYFEYPDLFDAIRQSVNGRFE